MNSESIHQLSAGSSARYCTASEQTGEAGLLYSHHVCLGASIDEAELLHWKSSAESFGKLLLHLCLATQIPAAIKSIVNGFAYDQLLWPKIPAVNSPGKSWVVEILKRPPLLIGEGQWERRLL